MRGRPRHILPMLVLLSLLSGCADRQSTLSPGGPAARTLSHLGWFIYVLFCLVAIIMWVLIAWAATRRRGSLEEHAPVDVGGGQPWILIGGFAIPFVILAVVFISGLRVTAEFPMHDGEMPPAEIRVTGHQWWWQIDYLTGPVHEQVTTANEIHIPAGRPVDIDLASVDVIHSLWVPRLHGKVDLIPGRINRIRIQADRPGVYSGQCAEFCGAQHAHMMIVVMAQPPEEFQAWLAQERQDAVPPATQQETEGQGLFLSRPCGLCHTIRGTLAHGAVGPDLTHFASRRGIAANALENNEANLAAWVTHAQSLKPEAEMPNITQFKGAELRAIVAYLRELR